MSTINVQIINKTINVEMNRSSSAWYKKPGITINAGSNTIIDTGQSSVRPIEVIFENASGKEITRSLQPRTVTLSGNYYVTVYSVIEFNNITMYYR